MVATEITKQDLPIFLELLELAEKKATANKKAWENKQEGRGETKQKGVTRWTEIETYINKLKMAL